MSRLWPRTLTAQLVILLLLALFAAQLVTFAILHDERRGAFEALVREQVLERAAALVRLTETTLTKGERRRALRAFSTRQLRFWLADEPVVGEAEGAGARHLARRLEGLLDDGREVEVRVAQGDIRRPAGRPPWQTRW